MEFKSIYEMQLNELYELRRQISEQIDFRKHCLRRDLEWNIEIFYRNKEGMKNEQGN